MLKSRRLEPEPGDWSHAFLEGALAKADLKKNLEGARAGDGAGKTNL